MHNKCRWVSICLIVGASCSSDVASEVDSPQRGVTDHAAVGVDTSSLSMSATAAAEQSTLILYDSAPDDQSAGELDAAALGTLVSHFSAWKAATVSSYKAGDLSMFNAVVYMGANPDAVLPSAFLDDVANSPNPVLWINANIGQLTQHVGDGFADKYGFVPGENDSAAVAQVSYQGATFARHVGSDVPGIMNYQFTSAASTTLAEAIRPDGTKFPWAIHGANLTYVGEDPLSYIDMTDRYVVFCDLLFDVLAPNTSERHRALVRIEDVSADSDPMQLQAIADYLESEQVPFSVATIPQFLDPRGYYNNNVAVSTSLQQAPQVVAALNYMAEHGGTLIMHGYTHQYSDVNNPYSGVSADDFEFWRAHLDAQSNVQYDGPILEDSRNWAAKRITTGLSLFTAAGLAKPTIFEWPHYAASELDEQALKDSFGVVYHQALYFPGILTGAKPKNYNDQMGLFVPYLARDAYGFLMIPENLDHYEPDAANGYPARTGDDIVRDANLIHVVRDGFASFYFHPYFGVDPLKPIISGIKAAGYQFVSPAQLLEQP